MRSPFQVSTTIATEATVRMTIANDQLKHRARRGPSLATVQTCDTRSTLHALSLVVQALSLVVQGTTPRTEADRRVGCRGGLHLITASASHIAGPPAPAPAPAHPAARLTSCRGRPRGAGPQPVPGSRRLP